MLLAYVFSHITLCGMVACYAILGAVMFRAIELPEEDKRRGHMVNDTNSVAYELLRWTSDQTVLKEVEWKKQAHKLLRQLEHRMVIAVNFEGYDGNDEHAISQWTFSGALLYSFAVITTIGYGHIVPKTTLGRMMTCVYATIGIPLMLMCLANIAESLAQVFTFVYFRVCCSYCRWKEERRMELRRIATMRARTAAAVYRKETMRLQGGRSELNHKGRTVPPSRETVIDISDHRPLHRNLSSRAGASLDRKRHTLRTNSSSTTDQNNTTTGSPLHKASSVRNDSTGHPVAVYQKVIRRSPQMQHAPFDVQAHAQTLTRGSSTRRSAPTRSNNIRSPLVRQSTKKRITLGSGNGELVDARAMVMDVKTVETKHTVQKSDSNNSAAQKTNEKRSSIKSTPSQYKETLSVDSKQLPWIVVSDEENTPTTIESGDDVVPTLYQPKPNQPMPPAIPEAEQTNEPSVKIAVSNRKTTRSIGSWNSGSGGKGKASISQQYHPSIQKEQERMPVSVGIVTVIAFIAGGAILFAIWEEWNIFDGGYFCFITLTTIGFGDIVPTSSMVGQYQEALMINSMYMLIGMALIAMCFKLMQDTVVQKTRWLGQKLGLLTADSELYEAYDDFWDDEDEEEEEDESGSEA